MINLIMSLVTVTFAQSEPIRVVVIDTGIQTSKSLNLCEDNKHKDFTGTGLIDRRGHGQNVSHLIQQEVKFPKKYCQIILKYSDSHSKKRDLWDMIKAIEYAATLKNVSIVNISSAGEGFIKREQIAIKKLLDSNIKVVVAAGNAANYHKNVALDLGRLCIIYPACYDARLIVVGNGKSNDSRQATSNYGTVVDYWIDGKQKTAGNVTLSGTSQSAAIMTGRLVNDMTKEDVK